MESNLLPLPSSGDCGTPSLLALVALVSSTINFAPHIGCEFAPSALHSVVVRYLTVPPFPLSFAPKSPPFVPFALPFFSRLQPSSWPAQKAFGSAPQVQPPPSLLHMPLQLFRLLDLLFYHSFVLVSIAKP
ncbi:hypothetical protein AX774_g722 [Zancudomyces culisetae]|uniref:Uncharacterized protein n=1 Tax=Zancudomyces culisetae TaxID=1213189 RepID=A0A1R1PXL6_ZANCU|nr:hypothetical protein AX774_g722 [Zancudomyces culisetae]|eukprot:OMH85721.1 hypothetical protein AX774_g722 [Zancudomyces culisetae]